MFIRETIKITIPKGRHLKSWQIKLNNYELIGGEELNVHWKILKTTTYRTECILVKCDDCNVEFKRRIRDLNELNYHLCSTCRKIGDRNSNYGKPINDAFRLAREKLIIEKGNPFTWPGTIEKIKNSPNFKNKGLKIRGTKRSEETKKKMSDGIKRAYEIGKLKPKNNWSNIEVKKYKNIEYQGSYELKFLQFIDSMGKLHLIERGPIIKYTFEDNIHSYFSDYAIRDTNIVFEIKSSYYWKKKLDINLAKKSAAELEYNYYLILDNNFKNIENLFNI